MRNYKKNPNFSSPAGSRRRKSRRSRRSSTSFKDSRKSRKEPKNHLLPPTHSLRRNICCRRKSRRRSPAGLKWEEKLKKRYHEVEKERQPENPPPFYLKLPVRRKTWPPPEKEKNFENHLHTHRSAASFFVLWRRERYKPK